MDKIDEKIEEISEKYEITKDALKEMVLYAVQIERERIKEQVNKLKINEIPESLESEKAICFGFNEGIEKVKELLTKDTE